MPTFIYFNCMGWGIALKSRIRILPILLLTNNQPMIRLLLGAALVCLSATISAQTENVNKNPFRQLYTELPTPNVYRNAAGAPGHEYWQQQADYEMEIRLDDKEQRIYGTSEIEYFNNSPDPLDYLWIQLDQNVRALDSDTYTIGTGEIREQMSLRSLAGSGAIVRRGL